MATVLNKIELFTLYTVFFFLPLLFLPFFPNNFDTPKLILLFAGFVIIGISKILKTFIAKKSTIQFTKIDIWVFVFVAIYTLSAVIKTPNPYDAFFVPGTASFVILSGIYYLFFNQLSKNKIQTSLSILTASAVVLAITQILAFLGIFKEVGFTTFGGLTTSLVFLVSTLSISVYRIIKSDSLVEKILNGFISFTIFVSSFSIIYLLLPGKPASLNLPSFSTSWAVSVDTLKSNPILGIGPGNYIESFNKFKPLEFNLTKNWNIRFPISSSQLLTLLTETGILGLFSYIALLFLLFRKINLEKPEYFSVLIIVVFTVFISFSPSLLPILFILFSISSPYKKREIPLSPLLLINLPFLVIIVLSSYFASKVITSEYRFNQALQAIKEQKIEPAFKLLNQAITINPKIDRYHLVASSINLAVAQSISKNENLSEEDKNLIIQLVQQGILEAKAATSLNPKRAGNWENLGNVYVGIIPFAKGADQFALAAYSQAIFLDPINPNLRIALGGVYYSQKNFDEAIKAFELATIAKPDLPNAHYNLAIAYKDNNQPKKSKTEIEKVLSLLDRNSQDYQKALDELKNVEELTLPPAETKPLIDPQIDNLQ